MIMFHECSVNFLIDYFPTPGSKDSHIPWEITKFGAYVPTESKQIMSEKTYNSDVRCVGGALPNLPFQDFHIGLGASHVMGA